MNYLRARYYDPNSGQFISRDTVFAKTREPYAYTQDNPLNATDPTGLFGWDDVKNAAHHVLNFIATTPYAQYYVAYQDLRTYGPYLPPPLVGYLELQQASGLAGTSPSTG